MTFNLSLFYISRYKIPAALGTESALYPDTPKDIQAKANKMILNRHLSYTASAVNTKKRLPDY